MWTFYCASAFLTMLFGSYLACWGLLGLGCLIAWGFTCKLVRGCPIVPCFEHVRAGGGG